MKELLKAAEGIIRQAGSKARDRIFGCEIEADKPFGDFRTSADSGIEAFVAGRLHQQFPDDGFDGEERGRTAGRSGYIWVLDPIDGTKYYFKHLPLYSVSLALEHQGELVLGVVYAPELDHMYCAATGSGATWNGDKIACSTADDLRQISVCLEIPSVDSPAGGLPWAMEKMAALVSNTHRIRILGVGSLSLCFCASGAFDAYVNLGSALKPYDIAAGRAIVQEAGGQFLSFGKQDNLIVAGPEKLCTQIRGLLGL